MIWQKSKSKYSGKFIAYDIKLSKIIVSDDLINWTPIGETMKIPIYHDIRLYNNILIHYPRLTDGIYYSDDYSNTWKIAYPDGKSSTIYSSMCYDGKYIYVQSQYGDIRYTEDMITWNKLNTNIKEISNTTSYKFVDIMYCKKYNIYVSTTYGRYAGVVYHTTDIKNPEWGGINRTGDPTIANDEYCIYFDGYKVYIYDPVTGQFKLLSDGYHLNGKRISLTNPTITICNGYLYVTTTGYDYYPAFKLRLDGFNNLWEDWNHGGISLYRASSRTVGDKIYAITSPNYKLSIYEYNTINDTYKITAISNAMISFFTYVD